MSGELVYVTLGVEDAGRATAFFGDVLGWEFGPGTGADRYRITNAGAPAGLHGGGGGARLFFGVEDLDAAMQRVVELGGRVGSEIDVGAAGRSVDCIDDQGTEFSLFETA